MGFIWTGIQWSLNSLHVSISIATPKTYLNPDNILTGLYEIKNEGEKTLNRLEFTYSIKKLSSDQNLTINGDENFGSTIVVHDSVNQTVTNLESGKTNTIYFPENLFRIAGKVTYVDMAVKIKVKVSIFKFFSRTSEQIFRFQSVSDTKGRLWLMQVPPNKK